MHRPRNPSPGGTPYSSRGCEPPVTGNVKPPLALDGRRTVSPASLGCAPVPLPGRTVKGGLHVFPGVVTPG